MSNDALPTFRFPIGAHIAQAQATAHAPVTLESPAIDAMTDLAVVNAATTQPQLTLVQAEKAMIQRGVRLLFVSSDMSSVEGIVTSNDIHGPNAMRAAQERQIHHNELKVSDVMTPLAELDAVPFSAIQRANVGQLVATLQRVGRRHLLIVEDATATKAARVRGIVSATQIERQLGTAMLNTTVATTFAEIERALS